MLRATKIWNMTRNFQIEMLVEYIAGLVEINENNERIM